MWIGQEAYVIATICKVHVSGQLATLWGAGGGLHHTYSELRVVLGVVLGVVLEKWRVVLNGLEVFINHQGFSFLSCEEEKVGEVVGEGQDGSSVRTNRYRLR